MDKKENTTPDQDSTEQKIFDAAHEIFTQKGMDGAKMQEIADKAGINKALLHYYYRSKEKLYEAVVKAVMAKALPTVRQVIESELPLEEKITRFIDFYIGLISKNTFIPLFIISEINKHPDHFFENVMPKQLPQPEIFFRQVQEEVAAGRIRPIDPRHLIINIISLCIFPFLGKPLMRMLLGLSPEEMKKLLDQRKQEVTSFVLAGLKPVQHPESPTP
ncbi:MAG TPA: TetR/AcrR family transcriptional regulator [Saprospiraceae bacterium]|nr:TetR/AcrR family transcriptional regulator [Saprospiraceae bacterium]